MRLDLSFYTWVLTRRLPLFALVATLIFVSGSVLISRMAMKHVATSTLIFAPASLPGGLTQLDPGTQFEYLRYQVFTSNLLPLVAGHLGVSVLVTDDVIARFNAAENQITLGFRHEDPHKAVAMTRAVETLFMGAAQDNHKLQLEQMVIAYRSDLKALDAAMIDSAQTPGSDISEATLRNNADYIKLARGLGSVERELAQPTPVLNVTSPAQVVDRIGGSGSGALHAWLLLCAVLFALAVISVLEWLDTRIRRPHDLERALGLSTFGVIPDLRLIPIKITKQGR